MATILTRNNEVVLPTVASPSESCLFTSPPGWLRFESGALNTEKLLGNLETIVSVLQTAHSGVHGAHSLIESTKNDLHDAWEKRGDSPVPTHELANLLKERLSRIDDLARNCSFHGRGLLNGQSGVVSDSNCFARGGPKTETSTERGYLIYIESRPEVAKIVGAAPLNAADISSENEVVVVENGNLVCHTLEGKPSPEQFVIGLQTALNEAQIDIDVMMDGQRRLVLKHRNYGSRFRFKAMSRNTKIISNEPGRLEWSQPGADVKGSINGEPALGNGTMLIGCDDNPTTAELVLLWDETLEPKSKKYCRVQQNGLVFQENIDPKLPWRRISLPNLQINKFGLWQHSRHRTLGSLRAVNWLDVQFSVRALFLAENELQSWKNKLAQWISNYRQQAMDCLANLYDADDCGGLGVSGNGGAEAMTDAIRQMLIPINKA